MAKYKKTGGGNKFHIEFKTTAQKLAWAAFQQHDILFLLGPAGVGKSFIATAFALEQILTDQKKNIVLTRPIVEAGERLGFLPGDFNEKVDPYMRPLYDCINKIVGPAGPQREKVDASIEVAPIAFLRGRTFDNSVCILDEAQNCTVTQLKLFLTRLGNGSKMIVDGDPSQCDIHESGLEYVVGKLETVPGIAVIEFTEESIVRHPVIKEIVRLI